MSQPEAVYPKLYEPQSLPALDGKRQLVFVGEPQNYASAHIAGARLVSPAELVCGQPPAPGRLADAAALNQMLTRIGYEPDAEIIICDDEGGGWAGRFAWTLDVIGHERWAYLNGGLHAWHGDGLPLQSGLEEASAPGTSVSIHIDRAPIAEAEDILVAIKQDSAVIWDVRSHEEYVGLRSGSARAGHIPGAVNTDWLTLMDPERNLRLRKDLASYLATHGVDGTRPTITHCQSHHRSGLSYMVGRLLGFENIRAYHGSWSEWGNRNDLPVER